VQCSLQHRKQDHSKISIIGLIWNKELTRLDKRSTVRDNLVVLDGDVGDGVGDRDAVELLLEVLGSDDIRLVARFALQTISVHSELALEEGLGSIGRRGHDSPLGERVIDTFTVSLCEAIAYLGIGMRR